MSDGLAYRFAWRNGDKRRTLYGRTCRILATGALGSALVEFRDSGQREIVSRRALRRIPSESNLDLFGSRA